MGNLPDAIWWPFRPILREVKAAVGLAASSSSTSLLAAPGRGAGRVGAEVRNTKRLRGFALNPQGSGASS